VKKKANDVADLKNSFIFFSPLFFCFNLLISFFQHRTDSNHSTPLLLISPITLPPHRRVPAAVFNYCKINPYGSGLVGMND
jgi:hypothetical protein